MSMIATALHYETVADSLNAGDYRVEAINKEKEGENSKGGAKKSFEEFSSIFLRRGIGLRKSHFQNRKKAD